MFRSIASLITTTATKTAGGITNVAGMASTESEIWSRRSQERLREQVMTGHIVVSERITNKLNSHAKWEEELMSQSTESVWDRTQELQQECNAKWEEYLANRKKK